MCRWQKVGIKPLLMVKMFLFTLSWGQVCIFPLFECNYDWKLFKFFLRERWKGWRLLFFFYPFCSQDFIGNSNDVSSENLILAQLIILWFIFSCILITFLLDFVSMLCFGHSLEVVPWAFLGLVIHGFQNKLVTAAVPPATW